GGTRSASCLWLPSIGKETSAGRYAVARAAPLHLHAEEAPDINPKGQQIPARNEPVRLAREPEATFDADTQPRPAGDGGRGDKERVMTGQRRAEERERKRMGQQRPGIAERRDASHGARRAQFAGEKSAQAFVKAGVADGESRDRDLMAGVSHRLAHLIVV